MKSIKIYADGSFYYKGNGKPGGWGACLIYKKHRKRIHGGVLGTTNNQMEMMAVIKALSKVKVTDIPIKVYSDSQYVIHGMKNWISMWKQRGWKTVDNKDLMNVHLWKKLYKLNRKFTITWIWVRGHSGNKYQEISHELATKGRESVTI